MYVSPQDESGGAVLDALLACPGRVMEESSHPSGLNEEFWSQSGVEGIMLWKPERGKGSLSGVASPYWQVPGPW